MRAIQLFIDSKGGASVATVSRQETSKFYLKPTGATIKRILDRATDITVHQFTTTDGSFVEVQYTVEKE